MQLQINMPAPDFSAPTTNDGIIELNKLRGKNIVLYFYPKDDTPGCTLEAKDFAEKMNEFSKLDTVIIGLSKDNIKSHEKFKEKYCLPFELASDETGEICLKYGVWTEKSMYGKKYMGIERTTFLIDKEGIIKSIWSKVSVTGHVNEVLASVQAINK